MSRSVLLQLSRDAMEEVIESKHTIDKKNLLKDHPLLNENIPTTINIYLNKKLKSSHSSKNLETSLLKNIIICSKKAAFEDPNSSPITTSEYLHCEIEIVLSTPDGEMKEKDSPIIS